MTDRMILVVKRDGIKEEYDKSKVIRVIEKAMSEGDTGVDSELAIKIEKDIYDEITNEFHQSLFTVEQVSDLVEDGLMKYGRYNTAKRFIRHRVKRDEERKRENNRYGILSKEFLSKYKHLVPPMTQLGELVYYRTYSRYLEDKGRREYWWETVRRAVEYNCSLIPTSREEAEKLYDNIFNLKQFLSGRTFWVGNTEVSFKYPMANYNCSFQVIDEFESFRDVFYLLLLGSGAGVRILKSDVNKIPKVRTDLQVIHLEYSKVNKKDRTESTSLIFGDDIAEIVVGDSKDGWTQALEYFFKLYYSNEFKYIKTILMNYNNVRPQGEKLKTFGGTASGHTALLNVFKKIEKIIKRNSNESQFYKLKPIDCLDISNILGEGVIVGGVRRTAEVVLMDSDDEECINAKSSLYTQTDGKWNINQDIIHRQMSNNSIFYENKPTRERLHWQIQKMRYSGEPAWISAESARKRRPNFHGGNPCMEILLNNKGLCNLTTLNVMSFVENGILNKVDLLNAQRLSARASYRMTNVELELPKWNAVQEEERLTGCSLTGWQDMVNATHMNKKQERELLKELRKVAHEEVKSLATMIGANEPLLVTTVKPEGTLSQLPTVSSGVHYSHSPYFIRRVRINSNDPLVKVCEELGYIIKPEVGQTIENCTTKVIEFPVKAPEGRTKYDVSAIEQLENYKMFMEDYVDHNCSITVHVRNHEWDEVEEWVWNNWDSIVAVSFLSLDDNFYELLPYESIEENEYLSRLETIKGKSISPDRISKYETFEEIIDTGNDGCDSGVCPIR